LDKKLKCLLLDDELPGLAYLKMLCEQIPQMEVVKAFNNPQLFLEELPSLEFDLCILDVEMPGINGLQVANLLGGKPVIFATAYKEYAAEAFDLDAVDYIRKPIQKERLEQAVQKALKRISIAKPPREFMQVNTDKGKTLIYFQQLGYIKTGENDSRDKVAYLKDGSSLYLKNISFDKLLEMLPSRRFCRINKKEIISLDIIRVFNFDEITSIMLSPDGKALTFTLSEIYRNDLLDQVNN
jgi:DNA-binding LytR/AlgR family response regulator